jgi:hypothetical protein
MPNVNPNDFDYLLNNELSDSLRGKVNPGDFDYWFPGGNDLFLDYLLITDVNSINEFDYWNIDSPYQVLQGYQVGRWNVDFWDASGPILGQTTIPYNNIADINSLETYTASQEPFPAFYGNINANIEVFNAAGEPFILWSPFRRAAAAPAPPETPGVSPRRRIFFID